MKLTYADPEKENWYLISWTLSNKCNYRCSYCPDFLHNGSSGWPEWSAVKEFVSSFDIPNKNICYRLSGGEPTYWKHFIELAKEVKKQGHAFSFLTNGSRDVEYFREISKYSDGIMLSYHPEYSDVNHFINIANNAECEVVVNLMMEVDCFDKQLEIANQLYENTNKLAIWPKVILDKTSGVHITNEVSNYTENQQQIIKDWPYFRKVNDYYLHRGELLLDDEKISANDLIIKELNKHRGWNCWAGLHMIKIDMHGNLYRSDCERGGRLGTIANYTLPSEPFVCDKDLCACLSDIFLRKESQIIVKEK